MVWRIICCLIGGYLFGCFSTAYIVGKWNKIDIRTYGSGNAGTTNALRTLGKKAGIITFIGDLLKALAAILLVRFLIFPDSEYVSLLELYTGLGVVLGHNYPFWLKFKGGRGVAVTTGVFFALQPIPSIFGLLSFIITVVISKYVSLASMVAVTFSSVLLMYCYDFQLHYCIILSLYAVIAIWRHRKNFVRILNKTESKLFEQKTPLVEVERNKQTGEGKSDEN